MFADVSSLETLLKVDLALAELGQVKGGNLLGLLDLLLVSAHLQLKRNIVTLGFPRAGEWPLPNGFQNKYFRSLSRLREAI